MGVPGVAVATVVSCCALTACGGQDQGASTSPVATAPAPAGGAAAGKAARWVPKPSEPTEAARNALAEAKAVCRGKRPRQVVMAHLAQARRHDAPAAVLARAAKLPSSRREAGTSGVLLAGAVYSYSRPAALRRDAAAGCVFALQKSLSNGRSKKGASR
jgi:hypothetical protein